MQAFGNGHAHARAAIISNADWRVRATGGPAYDDQTHIFITIYNKQADHRQPHTYTHAGGACL